MEDKERRLMITVKPDHEVDDVLPRIEEAGVDETAAFKFLKVIIGRVALDADYNQVVDTIKQMPEIKAVEPEPELYIN